MLAAASLSIGADGATSVTAIEKVCVVFITPSSALHGDVVGVPGRGLEIDLGGVGDGDDAGCGVDGEAAARGVADQRIGGGRSVGVVGGRGQADQGAGGGAFRDGLVAALVSTGVGSGTSETAMVKVCELVSVPSLACTVTV